MSPSVMLAGQYVERSATKVGLRLGLLLWIIMFVAITPFVVFERSIHSLDIAKYFVSGKLLRQRLHQVFDTGWWQLDLVANSVSGLVPSCSLYCSRELSTRVSPEDGQRQDRDMFLLLSDVELWLIFTLLAV
jgi:hypothetical protein